MDSTAQKLHSEAIIIDAVCPLLAMKNRINDYKAGGLTVVAPTVGSLHTLGEAFREIGHWHRLFRERNDLLQVHSVADIRRAKAEGKLGVLLHFQGTGPIEESLDAIDAFKALGVGVMQLTYNLKNRIGDGCEERTDSGLSRFGLQVIERMNAAKVVVDCSHTGLQTTMDALEHSSTPVVISHANPRAVHASPRNISDDLIKAVADQGGTIGIVGFPAFVSSEARPTMDKFIDHIAYVANLVGIEHVALGIDYFEGQSPYMPDDVAMSGYRKLIDTNAWSPESYPPPPYYYPEGIETPDKLANLTVAMLARGFTPEDIKKFYGENLLALYQKVWGA